MMLEQNSSMDATGFQLVQLLLACLLAESIEEVAFFLIMSHLVMDKSSLQAENVAVEGGKADSLYKHDIHIKPADCHNLLCPETVESFFILYSITEDPRYRDWGWNVFQAFERHTKVNSGGYTSLDDVSVIPAPKRDKMETFFLGEALKYLYLLFGDMTVLPLTQFVFNTEAHPLPVVGGQQYGTFITRNHDH